MTSCASTTRFSFRSGSGRTNRTSDGCTIGPAATVALIRRPSITTRGPYDRRMTFSDHDALVLLGLLVAAVTLLALAQPLRVPYPILLVLGGLAIGFVPGMPNLVLPPEVVLVGILPPLLYASAFYTSLVDLRRNAKPIGVLAIGLVLMTTVVVAIVAH